MNNLDCRVEKKVSKSGNEYYALVINITDTYEKVVFLDTRDVEILRLSNIID